MEHGRLMKPIGWNVLKRKVKKKSIREDKKNHKSYIQNINIIRSGNQGWTIQMYIQHRTQDTEQAQSKQKAQHRKLTTLAEQHKNKNKNKLANKWG